MTLTIDHTKRLTLAELKSFLDDHDAKVNISKVSQKAIIDCRNYLDDKLKQNKAPIYGINTGFGYLQNIKIDKTQLQQLQSNLIQSHACGMGEQVPLDIVKLMVMLKIKSLSYG
jgi:histidine ammonia-lyase